MQRSRLFILAGFAITVVAVGLIGLTPAAADAIKEVLVVNSPSQPVPVQQQGPVTVSGSVTLSSPATVMISGTPDVNAHQAGSWNVGITGTPTVKIDPTSNTVTISNLPTDSSGALRVVQRGRTVKVFTNVDIPGSGTNEGFLVGASLDTSDCRGLSLRVEYAPFSGGGNPSVDAFWAWQESTSANSGQRVGPAINASFGQLFYYEVPGTSMPLVAPAGFPILQNKTTTALHVDNAFLYCGA